MTLIGAILKVFGKRAGQTLTDFGAELNALTDKDREELAADLSKALGVEVIVPKKDT